MNQNAGLPPNILLVLASASKYLAHHLQRLSLSHHWLSNQRLSNHCKLFNVLEPVMLLMHEDQLTQHRESGWRKPLLPAANRYASTRKTLSQGAFEEYGSRIPRHLQCSSLVTPQDDPDWETISRFNDLNLCDSHCCLHEAQGFQSYFQSCPHARLDSYPGPTQASGVCAYLSG